MDKTFSGFDELFKKLNKYITLCCCNTIGQGLVDTYSIVPVGTGENIYTLRFIDKRGERHTFKTYDYFIVQWENGGEHFGKPYNSFHFRAYGKIDNDTYNYIENSSVSKTLFQNPYTGIMDDWILKEIRFELNNPELEATEYIGHDYELGAYIRKIENTIKSYTEYDSSSDSSSDSNELYACLYKDYMM